MSRESLEILLSHKIPSTAMSIVFKKLFVDWESFEGSCKFEDHDDSNKEILEFMYKALTDLYISLRNADLSSPYCDNCNHNLRGDNYIKPSKDEVKAVTDIMSKYNSRFLGEDCSDLEESSMKEK